MKRRPPIVIRKEPRGLYRKTPEALCMEAQALANAPAPAADLCPLEQDAERAFNAWKASNPEAARGRAAVWASANLPAIIPNRRRRAAAERLFEQGRAA